MNSRRLIRRGFTLIEMLVVIAVIGILAGLIMTAVSASIKRGRETKASAEARNIATAWEAYLREYSVWPSGLGGTEGSAYELVNVATNLLAGADDPSGANPRRICFFEPSQRELRDPWQHSYRYMLDLNYDGKITTPWGEVIGRNVIVWSAGVNADDSTEATRQDDRCSWR